MPTYHLFHLDYEACAADRELREASLDFKMFDQSREIFDRLVGAEAFVHAADVETGFAGDLPPLEEVFARTQNVDYSWAEGECVSASGASRRSTSVGDLAIDDGGNVHVCVAVGWQDFGPAPEKLMAGIRQPEPPKM